MIKTDAAKAELSDFQSPKKVGSFPIMHLNRIFP